MKKVGGVFVGNYENVDFAAPIFVGDMFGQSIREKQLAWSSNVGLPIWKVTELKETNEGLKITAKPIHPLIDEMHEYLGRENDRNI